RAMRSIAIVLALGSIAIADEVVVPHTQPTPQAGGPAPREVADPFATGMAVRTPPRPVQPNIVVPPEIAQLAKQLAGTYKCKGVTLNLDGSSTPNEAKITIKLDLGIAWIQTSFLQTTPAIRWTDYRTYDAVAKQW